MHIGFDIPGQRPELGGEKESFVNVKCCIETFGRPHMHQRAKKGKFYSRLFSIYNEKIQNVAEVTIRMGLVTRDLYRPSIDFRGFQVKNPSPNNSNDPR